MPFISLMTCIFIGYVVKPAWITQEMEKNGERFARKRMYSFMIRYVAPAIMALLFLQSTGLLALLRR